jgi:DNA integrity scanning protein DisA with diadenylate cyclase activity
MEISSMELSTMEKQDASRSVLTETEKRQFVTGKTPRITHVLLERVGDIAQASGANAVFVYVDALGESELDLPEDFQQDIFYVTRTVTEEKEQAEHGHKYIRVPDVPLTRVSQINVAVLLALYRNLINKDDTIVCLTGIAGSGSLDTISILQVGKEFEMFLMPGGPEQLAPHIKPEVLDTVLSVAAELGVEGREGKPVGGLFIIGDTDRVLSFSSQMVLNPFQGYPAENRNILDPNLKETVKEFATIDGAFLIRGDGTIETAGTYLKVKSQPDTNLPPGLGTRHHAAAAVTDVSEALAVVISESTGTVSLFRGGKIITEIHKRWGPPAPGREGF